MFYIYWSIKKEKIARIETQYRRREEEGKIDKRIRRENRREEKKVGEGENGNKQIRVGMWEWERNKERERI